MLPSCMEGAESVLRGGPLSSLLYCSHVQLRVFLPVKTSHSGPFTSRVRTQTKMDVLPGLRKTGSEQATRLKPDRFPSFTIMRSFLVLAALGLAIPLQAENWAQWRGPAFNGSSPEKSLPSEWSVEAGKEGHVGWKAKLPGPSGATPVVWGDSIFVSSPDENRNLCLLCLDRKDGTVRWNKTVVEGANMVKGRGNSSSPSPVTDGKAVYAMYSSGDLTAFDFTGKELWHRNLGQDYGKLAVQWLYGSSPLLFNGKLYVQVLQRSPAPPDYPGIAGNGGDRESYLLGLDPATGETLWKHVRETDARSESKES